MISVNAKISGLSNIKKMLERRKRKVESELKHHVVVGYSAPYAVYVHENMEMKLEGEPRPSGIGVYWGRPTAPGQSKFLEEPARTKAKLIGVRTAQVAKSTGSIIRALKAGGNLLKTESQNLVPVEYGDLKDSAYVEVV